MRSTFFWRFANVLLAAPLVGATAGCSSIAPASIDPIETQTEELFGQVQYELQLQDIVLLNPYLDSDRPKVDEFQAARARLSGAAVLLVDYSIDVIDLARITQDDVAVAALVPLLRDLHRRLGAQDFVGDVPGIDIDSIIRDVAAQPDLTHALVSAEPVHDWAAVTVRRMIDATGKSFDLAYQETHDKIVAENAAFITYTDKLILRRNVILEQLLLLEAAREGDSESWESLLRGDQRIRNRLDAGQAPSAAAIDEAEDILVARLGELMEIWEYLEPSWTNYQATLQELSAVESNVNDVLRVASFVIENWDRAQRQLAEGRPAGFIAVTKELAYMAIKRAASR